MQLSRPPEGAATVGAGDQADPAVVGVASKAVLAEAKVKAKEDRKTKSSHQRAAAHSINVMAGLPTIVLTRKVVLGNILVHPLRTRTRKT